MQVEDTSESQATNEAPTMRDVAGLGDRVRQRRKVKGMSLRSLAQNAEVSPSLLSKFENGVTNVSVGVLRKIADALSMSLPDLLDDKSDVSVSIVRGDLRQGVRYAAGFEITLLTRPHLAPVGIYAGRLDPGAATSVLPYSHGGEGDYEFILVTSGSIVAQIGGSIMTLVAGECLDFFSTTEHRIVNDSDSTAEIVWAIYPPR